MRLLALISAAALVPVFALGSALVYVEYGPGQDMATVSDLGFPVVKDLSGGCLVRAEAPDVARLGSTRLAFRALDEAGPERVYYLVRPRAGFDLSGLESCGRVLLRRENYVVLASTEAAVDELNRLPVELSRVRSEPAPLSPQFAAPPVTAPLPDSLVEQLVARVNPDSIDATLRRLIAFYTRYARTDSCRHAVAWIRSKLVEYGCDSTALDTFRSNYAPNVLGVKRGQVNPRQVYVVCGHVDNTSEQQPNHCPGSDDNGSGSTAVVEACRVFSDMAFDKTVYFIGFSGEEQGMVGSDSFASRARRRGDSIMGVLNFDMISYGRQNRDSLDVIGKPSSPNCAWLMDAFIANADTFTDLKTIRIMDASAQWSDHAAFWDQGYVAFCGIENDETPMYHTTGDTVGPLYYTNCGTNNVPMATEAIKAAVATLATLAGAHPLTSVAEPARAARPMRLLSVRPSVGNGPFTIELSRPLAPDDHLLVYNATGRLVNSVPAPANPASGHQLLTWDPASTNGIAFPAGIYILRVQSNLVRETARVVWLD